MASRPGNRTAGRVVVVAASMGALGALGAGVACITTPPPDLQELPDQPPAIVDPISPPAGVLTAWPSEFTVTVRMAKPGEKFYYEVLYDYGTASQQLVIPQKLAQVIPDGGTELITVSPKPTFDTSICPHEIELVVAAQFQTDGVPDSTGGDVVRWTYAANGSSTGCPPYDAGTGAFPEAGE